MVPKEEKSSDVKETKDAKDAKDAKPSETTSPTDRRTDTPPVDTRPETPSGRRVPPPAPELDKTRRSFGLELDVADLAAPDLAQRLAASFASRLPPATAETQPNVEELDTARTLLAQVATSAKHRNLKGSAVVSLHARSGAGAPPGFVQIEIHQGGTVHAQSLDRQLLAQTTLERVKGARKVVAVPTKAPAPPSAARRFGGPPGPAPSPPQNAPSKVSAQGKPAPGARDTIPPPARR